MENEASRRNSAPRGVGLRLLVPLLNLKLETAEEEPIV